MDVCGGEVPLLTCGRSPQCVRFRMVREGSENNPRTRGLRAVLVVAPSRLRLDASLRSPVARARPHEVPGLHLALALDQDRPSWPADELILQQLVRRARDLDLTRR